MSVFLVGSLSESDASSVLAGRPLRHFALYLPQNKTAYFSEIMNGALKSASENGAALSVHALDQSGDALKMAAYSGLDGIVVCPDLDDEVIFKSLSFLTANGLPLVLVNHNIPAEQPWPFVGTNNFDLGRKVAQLITTLDRGDLRLAIVYSDKSPAIFAERELVEMGIHAVLSRKLSGPIQGFRTDLNPRDAEKVTYRIVRSMPEVNVIVFTDLNDTLAGTQALIDLNLVGRVHVMGFGGDQTIVDSIKKGIITGSIVVNPSLMGYQSVRSLAELASSGYTSTSVDTGIDVISQENLYAWRSAFDRKAGDGK